MDLNLVIPCLLGLEAPIAEELRDIGAENINAENGRVLFSGDEHILARTNICSRYSERVQINVGSFKAFTFDELFEHVKALPWEMYIGKEDQFPVKGYSLNSTLFSVRDCQSIIKKAVVERLRSKYKTDWFEETGALYQIQFSIMKDTVTMLIDTSGAGLHKRGYRLAQTEAPIKETLAASMCSFARLRPYNKLYDPMCGSGTIVIEGAMRALHMAPGLNRRFSCEKFSWMSEEVFRQERARALDEIKQEPDFFAYGSDIDENALSIAKENAKRAGVENKIEFFKADIKDFEKKSEFGTVICNPPYGERLLDADSAHHIYEQMGEVFERGRGWSYTVISPDEQFEDFFGRRADKRRKLYNGMIKCQLYMYFK